MGPAKPPTEGTERNLEPLLQIDRLSNVPSTDAKRVDNERVFVSEIDPLLDSRLNSQPQKELKTSAMPSSISWPASARLPTNHETSTLRVSDQPLRSRADLDSGRTFSSTSVTYSTIRIINEFSTCPTLSKGRGKCDMVGIIGITKRRLLPSCHRSRRAPSALYARSDTSF